MIIKGTCSRCGDTCDTFTCNPCYKQVLESLLKSSPWLEVRGETPSGVKGETMKENIEKELERLKKL